jgi:hypothetical protein
MGKRGPVNGVPVRGEGLIRPGVVGVRGPLILRRPLAMDDEDDGAIREGRRCGVEIDDVERASDDTVRVRGSWLMELPAETGDWAVRAGAAMGTGLSSPSCHCKCRMTDFVAHWGRHHYDGKVINESGIYRHLSAFCRKPSTSR